MPSVKTLIEYTMITELENKSCWGEKVYRYETPFRGPYEKFQTGTNGTVTLHMRAVTAKMDILCIKPYNKTDAEFRNPLQ